MSKTNKSNQHFKVKALHYDEELSFLLRMLDARSYIVCRRIFQILVKVLTVYSSLPSNAYEIKVEIHLINLINAHISILHKSIIF